jgi:hypothetical protein
MGFTQLSLAPSRAIRKHICTWCGELINVGEMYQRESSIYDGEFQNHKWHNECLQACNKYVGMGDSEFCPHSFVRGTTDEK